MINSIDNALVVDDDILMREFIVETLTRSQIAVTQAEDGLKARQLLETNDYDIAFIDLKMPGMDGMEVLQFINTNSVPTLPVIVTAFGTVERAVEAMKSGAFDFLMKPFSPEQVEMTIKRARDWVAIKLRNAYLQEELGWTLPQGRRILGQSSAMQNLMDDIERIADSDATVLISGESGTGKELVALALHSLSDRSEMPFVRMNCAAVPDTLMDSELFGHEKGAFTGAVARRVGRFELASRGTLLMDEISEMQLGLQAKLLRVLQEQEFERVGGSRTIRSDCRIIATTNVNLMEAVSAGEFRHDLYYRLNVLPLQVPPLRERPEDIPLLARAFLKRLCDDGKSSDPELRFTDDALECMSSYSWAGNVRELENMVARLAVLGKGPVFGVESLPPEITGAAPRAAFVPGQAASSERADTFLLADIERQTIIDALRACGGSRQKTADLLGISVRTLRNKVNQYRDEGFLPRLVESYSDETSGMRAA